MRCSEEVSRYSEVLSGIREYRTPGSTEAALSVLKALARVLYSCGEEIPAKLPELVRAAVDARPTSQAVRNLLQVFLERAVERASSLGIVGALSSIDQIVRDVEEYVYRTRELVAELGSRRLEDGDVVMTHSYSATVLRLLSRAFEKGVRLRVYVTESRPGGEGRLTASYLNKMGIRSTLIVDSAVRYVMKDVDKVVVGAEAIAANGAVVNKVGTSVIALAAKEARVRVYIAAGLYKFGSETIFGDLVTIEEFERPDMVIPQSRIRELGGFDGRNLRVKTPLYDVTPPEYVDAIITEKGLIAPQAAIYLARELVGWPRISRTLETVVEEVVSLWR